MHRWYAETDFSLDNPYLVEEAMLDAMDVVLTEMGLLPQGPDLNETEAR